MKEITPLFFRQMSIIGLLLITTSQLLAQNNHNMLSPKGENVTDPLQNDVRLRELTQKLHSTVYIKGSEITLKSKRPDKDNDIRPVKVRADIGSLETINNPSFSTAGIELIVIRLDDKSDLKTKIDPSIFNKYESLRYVQLKATFKCNVSELEKILNPKGTGFSVLYSVQVPS